MRQEYVQDLAGEDANIIFGAMYDDSKSDEATITVIATGLHNVGGTQSKLQSRLEHKSSYDERWIWNGSKQYFTSTV